MKIKEKILNYLKTYWGESVFMKSVSLFVAACFIINLANLPAYSAPSHEEKERQERTRQEGMHHGHSNQGIGAPVNENIGTAHQNDLLGNELSPEIQMMLNQRDIRINEYNNIILMNRNGNERIIGTWDPEQRKVIITTFGEAEKNKDAKDSMEQELTHRVIEYFNSGGVAGKQSSFVSTYGPKRTRERQPSESNKKPLESGEKSSVGDEKSGVPNNDDSAEDLSGSGYSEPNIEADTENTETEKDKPSAVTSELDGEKNPDSRYDNDIVMNIVSILVKQTGLSEDEIITGLKEAESKLGAADVASEGLRNGNSFGIAMSVLNEFLDKGGEIINCLADAFASVADGVSKGPLVFHEVAADIALGAFTKDSVAIDESGNAQIMTNMSAINEAMRSYGKETAGYGVSIEQLINGLDKGDSAMVWVDGNKFITVLKAEGGNITVFDPNKNSGQTITYEASEFAKLMSGEAAKAVDGSAVSGYMSITESDIKMKILTDSKGISYIAGKEAELNDEDMSAMKGAKYVSVTVTDSIPVTNARIETRIAAKTDPDTQTEVQYTYEVEIQYVDIEEYTRIETVLIPDSGDLQTQRAADAERKAAKEEALAVEVAALQVEIDAKNFESEMAAKVIAEKVLDEMFASGAKPDKNGNYTSTDEAGNKITIHIMTYAEKKANNESANKIKEFFGVKEDNEKTAETSAENEGAAAGETKTSVSEYDGIIMSITKMLMEQTGLSEDEIIAGFKEAEAQASILDAVAEGIRTGGSFGLAVTVLKEFLENGGEIINCSTDALSSVLGGDAADKGLLAFQTLLADIAIGAFTQDSIKDGQINTSMAAMKEVMSSYGREAEGYGLSVDELMNGLKEGESAVLWVDGNHFITVTKKDGDNFSVTDSNKNSGRPLTYEAGELKKLLSGEAAQTATGETSSGYANVFDENGKMKVLTDSKGIANTVGTDSVLSSEEMKSIKGSRYVAQPVTRSVSVAKTRTETRIGTKIVTNTYTATSEGYYNDDGDYVDGSTYTYTQDEEIQYTYEVTIHYTEMEEQTTIEMVWVDDPEDSNDEKAAEEERKLAEEEAKIAEKAALDAEIERKNLEAELAAKAAAEKAIEEMLANQDAPDKNGDYTSKDEDGKETTVHLVTKEEAEENEKKEDGDETKATEFAGTEEDLEAAKGAEAEKKEEVKTKQEKLKNAVIDVFKAAENRLLNATDLDRSKAQNAFNAAKALCENTLKDAVLVNKVDKTVTFFDENGNGSKFDIDVESIANASGLSEEDVLSGLGKAFEQANKKDKSEGNEAGTTFKKIAEVLKELTDQDISFDGTEAKALKQTLGDKAGQKSSAALGFELFLNDIMDDKIDIKKDSTGKIKDGGSFKKDSNGKLCYCASQESLAKAVEDYYSNADSGAQTGTETTTPAANTRDQKRDPTTVKVEYNGATGTYTVNDTTLNFTADFTKEEFEKLMNGQEAHDKNGRAYDGYLGLSYENKPNGEVSIGVDSSEKKLGDVTIIEETDGKGNTFYTITDPSKNNGAPITYNKEEFEKLMSGKNAKDVNNAEHTGYFDWTKDEDGNYVKKDANGKTTNSVINKDLINKIAEAAGMTPEELLKKINTPEVRAQIKGDFNKFISDLAKAVDQIDLTFSPEAKYLAKILNIDEKTAGFELLFSGLLNGDLKLKFSEDGQTIVGAEGYGKLTFEDGKIGYNAAGAVSDMLKIHAGAMMHNVEVDKLIASLQIGQSVMLMGSTSYTQQSGTQRYYCVITKTGEDSYEIWYSTDTDSAGETIQCDTGELKAYLSDNKLAPNGMLDWPLAVSGETRFYMAEYDVKKAQSEKEYADARQALVDALNGVFNDWYYTYYSYSSMSAKEQLEDILSRYNITMSGEYGDYKFVINGKEYKLEDLYSKTDKIDGNYYSATEYNSMLYALNYLTSMEYEQYLSYKRQNESGYNNYNYNYNYDSYSGSGYSQQEYYMQLHDSYKNSISSFEKKTSAQAQQANGNLSNAKSALNKVKEDCDAKLTNTILASETAGTVTYYDENGLAKVVSNVSAETIEALKKQIVYGAEIDFNSVLEKIKETNPNAKVTNYAYDEKTINAIMTSTGATREEVLKQLNLAEQDAQSKNVDFQKVLDIITDLINKGVEIVNDAALALKQVIGGAISAGALGLAALAADIVNALAGGADKDSAVETYTGDDGKTYVRTSMAALNSVLNKNGKASAGYATTVEDFMDSLAPGESAILWVDGNRFITVTKRQDWNSKENKYDVSYEVTDPNRYDGETVKYDADNFKNLITGKRATSKDGRTNLGYKGSEDGNVNFLAAGYSTKNNLNNKAKQDPESVSVLTDDKMSDMKGTTDRTKKVLVVTATQKTVWETATREVIVEQPEGSGIFIRQIQTYQYEVTLTELGLEEREGTENDWKDKGKGDTEKFGQEGLKEMQEKYNGAFGAVKVESNTRPDGVIESYTITDPNQNGGKPMTFTPEEYAKLMRGEDAEDTSGAVRKGYDPESGLNGQARKAARKAAEQVLDNNGGVLANVEVTGTPVFTYTLMINGQTHTFSKEEYEKLLNSQRNRMGEYQTVAIRDVNGSEYMVRFKSKDENTGEITFDIMQHVNTVEVQAGSNWLGGGSVTCLNGQKDSAGTKITLYFDDKNLNLFLDGQKAIDINGKEWYIRKSAEGNRSGDNFKVTRENGGDDKITVRRNQNDYRPVKGQSGSVDPKSKQEDLDRSNLTWTVTDKNDLNNSVVFDNFSEFEKYTRGEEAKGKDGKMYQNPAYAGGSYYPENSKTGTVRPDNGSSTQNDRITVKNNNDGSTSVNFYIGGDTILDISITLPKGTLPEVVDEVKNMILAGKTSDEIAAYLKDEKVITDANIQDTGVSDIIDALTDKFGPAMRDKIIKAFSDAFADFGTMSPDKQKAFLAGIEALTEYLSYPDASFDIPAARAAAAALNRQDFDMVGLELVLQDIAEGRFSKDNILVASGGPGSSAQTVLIVSFAAIKAMMPSGYEGYRVSVDDIIDYLNSYSSDSPESVIIQVSGNHFITVKKGADGSFSLFDSSIKDGNGITLTKEQLSDLLSGKDIFVGPEGSREYYKGYQIEGAPGSLKVLTNSQKIKETEAMNEKMIGWGGAPYNDITKLTDDEMKAQTGGQYVDIPVMGYVMEDVKETRSYTDAGGVVHYYEVTVQRVVPKLQTQRVWASSADEWETKKDEDGNEVKVPKKGTRAEAEQEAYDASIKAQDASLRAQAAEHNMKAEADALAAAKEGKGGVNVSVTATVDAKGNISYQVTDPNMNGGKTLTFSREEYEKLQRGLPAVAQDGKEYQGLAHYNEEYKNNLAASYFVLMAEAVSTAKTYLDTVKGTAAKAEGVLADAQKMFDDAFNTLVEKLGLPEVVGEAAERALYDAITYIYGIIGILQSASIDAVLVLANAAQSIADAAIGALTSVANPFQVIADLAAKLAKGEFIKDDDGKVLGIVVDNGDGSVGVWGPIGKEGDLWIDQSRLGPEGQFATMEDLVKFIAGKMSMTKDDFYSGTLKDMDPQFDDVAWSFEDVSAYLRSTGLFEKEAKYDPLGNLLYVAENVGYLPGTPGVNGPQMAVLYTFYGDDYYSNDTTLTGVAKGEQKLVIEEYMDYAGNGKTYVKTADTYSVSKTPEGQESNIPAKTNSGMQINLPGMNVNLERRVIFVDNDPDKNNEPLSNKGTDDYGNPTKTHARNGYVLDYTGEGGMLNGYEILSVRSDGTVYVTRYDLTGAIIPGGKPNDSDDGQQQGDAEKSFTLLNILAMTLNLDSPEDEDKVIRDENGNVIGIMDWDPLTHSYTYYGPAGKEGDLTINPDKDGSGQSLSDKDAKAIADGVAAGWSYNDIVAYLKYNGLLSKEVRYDNTGAEIYTAELQDYKDGKSVYKYTFKQDNSDYPALYDAKAGESYIVVEDFSKGADGKCAIQRAITYAYDEDNDAVLTTKDGLKVPNAGKAIRGVQYTYPGDIITDKDGNPTGARYDAKVLIGIFDDKTGDFVGAYSSNIADGILIGGMMYSVEAPASMHFFREVSIDAERTNPAANIIGFDNGMTIGVRGDFNAVMGEIEGLLAAGWSYEEIIAKLKSEDKIQTETKYDENGKEIYTATRVENDGKGNAVFSYTFKQDYTNNTFLDAKAGETKVVFERYGTVDAAVGSGSQKRTRMTGAITYASGTGKATQFGLKDIGGVGAMERAVQFKYPYEYEKEGEDGQTETVKCDGAVFIAVFDTKGDIMSFNKGLIENNVLSVTEYNLKPEDIMTEEQYKQYLKDMGIESAKLKMSVDENTNTITISSGGSKDGDLEISGDIEVYKNDVQRMIDEGYTYDEIAAYLKHKGVLKSETRYDDDGKPVYRAELAGYKNVGGGKVECAYRYTFYQSYTNGGSLNVAQGDLRNRIVVEEYGTADGKIRQTASMTYVEGGGYSSSNTTRNGMTFSGSIGYLERACEYTYPYNTKDKDGNPLKFPGQVMTAVFNSNGALTAFEFGTILESGDVSVYGYDLTKPNCLFNSQEAYEEYIKNYHPELLSEESSGSGSGGSKDGPADLMRKAMQNIERLKLRNNESLYNRSRGFNSFTDKNEKTQLHVYLDNAGEYDYQTYKEPSEADENKKTEQSAEIKEFQDALRDLGFTNQTKGQIGLLLRNEIYINIYSVINRKTEAAAAAQDPGNLTAQDIVNMLNGLSDLAVTGEGAGAIFGSGAPQTQSSWANIASGAYKFDLKDFYAHWVAGSSRSNQQSSLTQQMQAIFGAVDGTLFDEGENANTANSIYANHNAFMNNDFYVDMSKANIYTYDSANPYQLSYNGKLNGMDVTITAQIKNPADWRKNGADINTNAGGSVTYSDGKGTYSRTVSGVQIDKDFNPVFDTNKDYQLTEQISYPEGHDLEGGYKLNIYNVSGFSAEDFVNWKTSAAQGKYGYTWYDYGKDGILAGMGYDYKAGHKARTGIGDDTITFIKPAKASWTVTGKEWKDGGYQYEFKLESGSADITAAYSHYRDGKLDATGVFTGTYSPHANGAFILNGDITVDAGQTMTIDKPKSSASAFAGKYGIESIKEKKKKDGESQEDAAPKDAQETEEENNTRTNAKIIETADSYLVSGGVVSIVNSAFVVIGNGTILHTGSFLFSIGEVIAGQMQVFVENGQYVYRAAASSGTAEVRIIDPDNKNISITTMYDVEGVIKITKYNKAMHALQTIEYKTYNLQTGKYETVLNAYGFAATITVITASRTGDTGFGYIVENMAGNSAVEIIIGADGSIKLNAKTNTVKIVVAKIFGTNTSGPNAGDSFVMVIFDGGKETRYELRQKDGSIIEMITLDGKTFIGVKKYEVRGSIQMSAEERERMMGSYGYDYGSYGYDPYGYSNSYSSNYSSEMTLEEENLFWRNARYGDSRFFGFGNGKPEGIDFEWDTILNPNDKSLYFMPDGSGGGTYMYSYMGYDLLSLTLNTDAYGNPYTDGVFFTVGDAMKGANPLRGPPNGSLTQAYYDGNSMRTYTINFDASTGKISYDKNIKIDKFLDPSRNQWLKNEGEYQLPGGEIILAGSAENPDGTRVAIDFYWMKDDGTFQGLRELTQIGNFYIRKADYAQDNKYNINRTVHTENETVIDFSDINYILTTRSGANISFGSSDIFDFNQSAGNTFILSLSRTVDSKGKPAFSIDIKLPMAISVDYKSRDPKSWEATVVSNLVIVAGASVVFTEDRDGNITANIFDGILDIGSSTIYSSSGGGSSGGGLPPDASDTNAIVNDQVKGGKNGKEVLNGWYEVTNGTISIRNGSLVIFGLGAVFRAGSNIMQNEVLSGSVKVVGSGKGVYFASVGSGGAVLKFQGKKVSYDENGVAGNRYKTTSYTGDDGKEYKILKLDKYGRIEKQANNVFEAVGFWVEKNWRYVVAAVVIIIAVIVTIVSFGAASPATGAASGGIIGWAAGTAIGTVASAVAGAAITIGASVTTAALLAASTIMLLAGLIVQAALIAGSWIVSKAVGIVTGDWEKADKIWDFGKKTAKESIKNLKLNLFFMSIGWEDGHFGIAWGPHIDLSIGSFRIYAGYSEFKSVSKVRLKGKDPDGADNDTYEYYTKKKGGIDFSYGSIGVSVMWSDDNQYGKRWTVGGSYTFAGVGISYYARFMEIDPNNSGQNGWTHSFGITLQNGAAFEFSYNTLWQTVGFNFSVSGSRGSASFGAAYSFVRQGWSMNVSAMGLGYNHSDMRMIDPDTGKVYSDGRRAVSDGFSLTGSAKQGSFTLSFTHTEVFGGDGMFMSSSNNWDFDLNLNVKYFAQILGSKMGIDINKIEQDFDKTLSDNIGSVFKKMTGMSGEDYDKYMNNGKTDSQKQESSASDKTLSDHGKTTFIDVMTKIAGVVSGITNFISTAFSYAFMPIERFSTLAFNITAGIVNAFTSGLYNIADNGGVLGKTAFVMASILRGEAVNNLKDDWQENSLKPAKEKLNDLIQSFAGASDGFMGTFVNLIAGTLQEMFLGYRTGYIKDNKFIAGIGGELDGQKVRRYSNGTVVEIQGQYENYYNVTNNGKLFNFMSSVFENGRYTTVIYGLNGSQEEGSFELNISKMSLNDRFELGYALSASASINGIVGMWGVLTGKGLLKSSVMHTGFINKDLGYALTVTDSNITYGKDGNFTLDRTVFGIDNQKIDGMSGLAAGQSGFLQLHNAGKDGGWRIDAGMVWDTRAEAEDSKGSYKPASFITSAYNSQTGQIAYINIGKNPDGGFAFMVSQASSPSGIVRYNFNDNGSIAKLGLNGLDNLASLGGKFSEKLTDVDFNYLLNGTYESDYDWALNILDILYDAGGIKGAESPIKLMPNINDYLKSKQAIETGKDGKTYIQNEAYFRDSQGNTQIARQTLQGLMGDIYSVLNSVNNSILDGKRASQTDNEIEVINKYKVSSFYRPFSTEGESFLVCGDNGFYFTKSVLSEDGKIKQDKIDVQMYQKGENGLTITTTARYDEKQQGYVMIDQSLIARTAAMERNMEIIETKWSDGSTTKTISTNVSITKDDEGNLIVEGEREKFNLSIKNFDKDGKLIWGNDKYFKDNWAKNANGDIQKTDREFSYQYELNEKGDDFVFSNVIGLETDGYNHYGTYSSLSFKISNSNVVFASGLNGKDGAFYTGIMNISGTDINGNFTGVVGMYYDAFVGVFTNDPLANIALDDGEITIQYVFEQGENNRKSFENYVANNNLSGFTFAQQLEKYKASEAYEMNYRSLTDFALNKDNNTFTGTIGVWGGQFDLLGNHAKYRVGSNNDIIQGKLSGSGLEVRYNNGKPSFYSIDDTPATVIKINGDITTTTTYNNVNGAETIKITSDKQDGYYTSPSTNERVHFTNGINLQFTRDTDGNWSDEGTINGTFEHYIGTGADGKPQYQELAADLSFKISSDGVAPAAVLHGKANKAKNVKVDFAPSEAGVAGAAGGQQPDAKDTRAIITTHKDGSMNVNGDISIRGLSLVVFGEGATALSGSVLMSNGNLVTTEGIYTMHDNQWMAGEFVNRVFVENESQFSYNDPSAAAKGVQDHYAGIGFNVGELDFSGKFAGNIPATYAQALSSYAARDGDVNATVNALGANVSGNGGNIILKEGDQVIFKAKDNGELGIYWGGGTTEREAKLFKGIGADFGTGIKENSLNLKFNFNDELTLYQGLKNTYSDIPVLVNTETIYKGGAAFVAGTIRMSFNTDVNSATEGQLTANFYQADGKTPYLYNNTFTMTGRDVKILAGATENDIAFLAAMGGYEFEVVNSAKINMTQEQKKEAGRIADDKENDNGPQTPQEREAQKWNGKDSMFKGKTAIHEDGDFYAEEGSKFIVSEDKLNLSNNDLAQSLLDYQFIFKTVGNVFLEGSDIPLGHVNKGDVVIAGIGKDGHVQWASYGTNEAIVVDGNINSPGSVRTTYTLDEAGIVTKKTEKNLIGTKRADDPNLKYVNGTEETIFGKKLDEDTGINVVGDIMSHKFINGVVENQIAKGEQGFTGVRQNVKSDGTLSGDKNYNNAKFQDKDGMLHEV
ncbi:MAG: hypothetical protein FWH43_03345, partial [Endomicrobia bacterium]|nr:hypothetical protein [Endomicrobiia bacterium]